MIKDSEIIKLFFERNEDAIQYSDNKYGGYCAKIAYNILYDFEDAKECVNETWLQSWNSIPPQKPDKLGIYFGRICRNLSINLFQKYSAEKRGGLNTDIALDELNEVIGKTSDVQEYLDESSLKDSINSFLRTIDEKNRKIFVRRYYYLSTVKEISDEYGLSQSNVKMSLSRTREKLREWLIQDGYDL